MPIPANPTLHNKKQNTIYSIRNMLTVGLLALTLYNVFFGLIGVALLWFWTSWTNRTKIILTVIVGSYAVITFAAGFALVTYMNYVRPFQMSGQAMSPTYKDGAYMFADIYDPQKMQLKRGDVIIFESPMDSNKDLIKRIIAVSGETVRIQDGNVYVNDKILDESAYLPADVKTSFDKNYWLQEGQTITVPEKHYFVLNDNRSFGADSRVWGTIPEKNVISIVTSCYWNCN
jgi:signal peptidase I